MRRLLLLSALLLACDARPVIESPWWLDPCGEPLSVALQKQIVPLLIGGGMNEKLDPKVMPADQLVNVTDAYRDKSGALRGRFGWAQMTNVTDTGAILASCRALFPLQGGKLGMIGSTAVARDALFVYSPTENKWMHNARGYQPLPMAVTSLTPVESRGLNPTAPGNLDNPNVAVAGNVVLTSFTDHSTWGVGSDQVYYTLHDQQTGAVLVGTKSTAVTGQIHRAAAGGSSYLVVFVLDAAGPGTIKAIVITVATLAVNTYTVANATVANFQTKFAARSRPGSNNIIVAFPAAAGGSTVSEFNPATGAIVTGPTNIAAANSASAIALLQDQFSTGSYYLATNGGGGNVEIRTLSAAFAVTATTTVDVAVTATGLTGHLVTATTYNLLWQVASGVLRSGTGTLGAASTVVDWMRALGFDIVSETFKYSGKWYLIVSWSFPSFQTTAFVVSVDSALQDQTGPRMAGIIMPAQAGGLAQAAGGAKGDNLASVVALSSSSFLVGLSRIQRITGTGLTGLTVTHSIVQATINFESKLARPRELGGTVFFPGGMVMQYDGTAVELATSPLYPEIGTIANGGAGSMTASSTYSWVATYKWIDSTGRSRRSAPSLVSTFALGVGITSVNVPVNTLRGVGDVTSPLIELWRAGPAASGAIIYNKVKETPSVTTADTVTLNDTMSDTIAQGQEILYDPLANGGVLNNFPSPSTQLLEVLDNRVFVVSAENPTEIWPSKEYKPGFGLAFHPSLVIRISGTPITALAAMDGRLIAFQQGQIWVIPIGAGPNDQGQGAFGDPQLVSLNVGCIDPNSVVNTPDGIMFQGAQGLYLMTRGFDVQYIGAAVEDTFALIKADAGGSTTPLAGAALGAGTNQVRFLGSDSSNQTSPTRALVYDYAFKQWFSWNLPTNDNSMVAMTTAGSTSYYADSNGKVWQETSNRFDETASPITWQFQLPALALGQLGGWALTYELQVIGDFRGAHTLNVQIDPSYSPTLGVFGSKVIAAAAASYQYAFRPKRQKATSMQPLIQVVPSGANEGATISALSLVIGVKPGRYPLAANRRLG